MAKALSENRRKSWNSLRRDTNQGLSSSVREICNAVGLKSTSTVHGYLERLEKKGFIRRDPAKPRAIEILTILFLSKRNWLMSHSRQGYCRTAHTGC